MAKMNLDLGGVSIAASFSVLDTGMYKVGITGAEIVESKNKAGHFMLNVTMTVKEGLSEGKSIINRMNIVNSNKDTEKWAKRDLKTVMTVGGHSNPEFLADSDELLALSDFNVSLEKKPQLDKDKQPVCNDKGEPYFENKYNGFFKASAIAAPVDTKVAPAAQAAPQAQATQATPAAAAPAAAQGEFPWS